MKKDIYSTIGIPDQLDHAPGKKGIKNTFPQIGDWLPRNIVKEFMGYGNTQMAAFEKMPGLVVSQIGNRKFIHLKSLIAVLEANILA